MSYQPLTRFVLSNTLKSLSHFTQFMMFTDFFASLTKMPFMELEVFRSVFILSFLFVFYLFLRSHPSTKKEE